MGRGWVRVSARCHFSNHIFYWGRGELVPGESRGGLFFVQNGGESYANGVSFFARAAGVGAGILC